MSIYACICREHVFMEGRLYIHIYIYTYAHIIYLYNFRYLNSYGMFARDALLALRQLIRISIASEGERHCARQSACRRICLLGNNDALCTHKACTHTRRIDRFAVTGRCHHRYCPAHCTWPPRICSSPAPSASPPRLSAAGSHAPPPRLSTARYDSANGYSVSCANVIIAAFNDARKKFG